MNLFMIPDRIRFVFELGDGTLKLANRIVDIVDTTQRLPALTARLKASKTNLAAIVAAHKDPDAND